MPRPRVLVLAGPKGAGKSTTAPRLLRDRFEIVTFVNADTIATGLSGFDPETSAFAAGRMMLQRIQDLAAAREDFAFETTLASRSFAPWLRALQQTGYRVLLVFLWLPDVGMALSRVRARVSQPRPALGIRRQATTSSSSLSCAVSGQQPDRVADE